MSSTPGRGSTAFHYTPLRKPGEKKQPTIQDGGVSNLGNKTHEFRVYNTLRSNFAFCSNQNSLLLFKYIIYT